MKKIICYLLFAVCAWGLYATENASEPTLLNVPSAIVYPFEVRSGAQDADGQIFAELLALELTSENIIRGLNREDLSKLLNEKQLASEGITQTDDPERLGKLLSARLFISGSCFSRNNKNYVIFKITGTATGEMVGGSVSGNCDWEELIPQIVEKIRLTIDKNAAVLLPEPPNENEAIITLSKDIDGQNRKVFIDITETVLPNNSVAARGIPDPAALTELKKILLALHFDVVENTQDADYIIRGEAIAAPAGNFRNHVSVAARIEVTITRQSDNKLLASDSATEFLAGSSYEITAKSTIGAATRNIALKILPKLAEGQKP